MPEPFDARGLLDAARRRYDDPASGLASASRRAWRRGFASGAEWMRLALEELRGVPVPERRRRFNLLGVAKYGTASAAASIPLLLLLRVNGWLAAFGGVLFFYAVEAQMVFLFPAALDRTHAAFRVSRALTRSAGGTLAVMWGIVSVAMAMLFGGFLGGGFVRSWSIGCLAIVIWYERVRLREEQRGTLPAQAPMGYPGARR